MATRKRKAGKAGKVGFVQQVREAVERSGMSRYQLSRQSGVDEAALSRFVHGGGLSMDSLDAIAAVLNLDVVARKGSGK